MWTTVNISLKLVHSRSISKVCSRRYTDWHSPNKQVHGGHGVGQRSSPTRKGIIDLLYSCKEIPLVCSGRKRKKKGGREREKGSQERRGKETTTKRRNTLTGEGGTRRIRKTKLRKNYVIKETLMWRRIWRRMCVCVGEYASAWPGYTLVIRGSGVHRGYSSIKQRGSRHGGGKREWKTRKMEYNLTHLRPQSPLTKSPHRQAGRNNHPTPRQTTPAKHVNNIVSWIISAPLTSQIKTVFRPCQYWFHSSSYCQAGLQDLRKGTWGGAIT